MKIVIPGGSGQVGTILSRVFHKEGHEVIVLSRKPTAQPWSVVQWDGETVGPWVEVVNGADVIINLAGRSVDCRYNAANRKTIMASRVNSTRTIGEAIRKAKYPPHTWLQASTATIYAHRYDQSNDELTGIIGSTPKFAMPDTWQFSIDVAMAWEQAVDDVQLPRTRTVKLRSAMVMSPDKGGVFDTLRTLVRYGLGGRSVR